MKYGSAYKARGIILPCLAAFFGIGLFCVGTTWTHPASAQSTDAQARLNRIENEIETLSRAIFKGEEPPAGSLSSPSADAARAALEVRLNQLEVEIRTLTGTIEQQGYEIRMLREQFDKAQAASQGISAQQVGRPFGSGPLTGGVYADQPGTPVAMPVEGQNPTNGARFEQITNPDGTPAETAAGAPATYTAQSGTLGSLRQGTAAPYAVSASNDPTAMYEQAFSLVKDGSYDQAQVALDAFLKQYPDHTLAPNARYWLGETHYVRKDYEVAARIFAEAYQQAPKGPKGPDNLLKLGLSLAGMGKSQDACVAFKQLKSEYGGTANPVIDRATREMDLIGCP
ncbi:MAG: tol-pal system protein YbgF [Micavibrio sp.]